MTRINVGVLRGGPSSEYSVSLETGGTVLKLIDRDLYNPSDIYISKDGVWHKSGMMVDPSRALNHVDVVFNALHGQYGEDGKVQHFLETHGIPYTGSDSFSSAIGMNKIMSKKVYARHGLKTPLYRVIKKDDLTDELLEEIFNTFPMPAIIKPVALGSSIGVSVVHALKALKDGVKHAFGFGDTVLIEEYIRGIEATCGVVEHFRGERVHALMPVEIRPRSNHFFDYASKYISNGSERLCPGNFDHYTKNSIEEMAKNAHQALGLRHYSRSDFIITPRRGIFILETNSLPGLTETSLLPRSLQAGGTALPHFMDHIVQLALGK